MPEDTSTEKSDAELVYEPGFGTIGSPEENIMVEKPIGVYAFKEKTRAYVQKLASTEGTDGEVMEAILVVDPKKKKLARQIRAALGSAMSDLMRESNFPKLMEKKPLDNRGSHQVIERSPVAIVTLGGWISESESGVKIDNESLVFCKMRGASDPDYVRSRNMLVEKANQLLELFEVKDLIPAFPPQEERRKI